MKTRNYLLPHSYKKIGMLMFLPFAAICLCLLLNVKLPSVEIPWIAIGDGIFYQGKADLLTELGMMGLLISLSFIALSREKDEDEMTGQIRMKSFGVYGLPLLSLLLVSCSLWGWISCPFPLWRFTCIISSISLSLT